MFSEFTKICEVTCVIKRVAEKLDDSTMKRIASAIKQNHNKLFSVVKSEAEAKEKVTDLQVNGYQANYVKTGSVYKIYYSTEPPKFANDNTPVQQNNMYANFSKAGLTKCLEPKKETYAFDEGTIWHVKEIDGVPYIVKEVAEDNEDNFLRKKATASAKTVQFKGELNVAIVQLLAKRNIIATERLVDEIKDNVLSKALKMPSIQSLIEGYCKGDSDGNRN